MTENTQKVQQTNGIKLRYIIEFHKAMTAFVILSLMNHYKNYSLGSFLYLTLHAIYGVVWILKGFAFPEDSLHKRVGFFRAMVNFFALSAYWILPFIQMSGHGIDKPSAERVMFTVALFTLGIAMLVGSEAQKTYVLNQRNGLITDGFFKFTRNPNYLGEMMIQASFAFATGSVIAWGIIISLWCTYFLPRMIAKDVSLRSKEGAASYFVRSSMLLPKFFFTNTWLHYLSWMAIFGGIFFIGESISWTHFFKKIHPFKYFSKKLFH